MPMEAASTDDTTSDICLENRISLLNSAKHKSQLPVIKITDQSVPFSPTTHYDGSQLAPVNTPKGIKTNIAGSPCRKRKKKGSDENSGTYVFSTPLRKKKKPPTNTLEACGFFALKNLSIAPSIDPTPEINGSCVFDLDLSTESFKSLNMSDIAAQSLLTLSGLTAPDTTPSTQDILNFLRNMDRGNKERDEELRAEVSRGNEVIKLEMNGIKERIGKMESDAVEAELRTASKIAALEEELRQYKLQSSTPTSSMECCERLNQLAADFEDLKKEIKSDSSKLNDLVENEEMRERARRKKNIIISGWQGPMENYKSETYNFLRSNFSLPENFAEDIVVQGKDKKRILVKLREFEDKIKILKSKKEVLKQKKIFIDSDLTKLEREIQSKLRDFARSELKNDKNKKVWVSYGKVGIDDKQFLWDQASSKLVPVGAKSGTNLAGKLSFSPVMSEGKGPPVEVVQVHQQLN